MKRCTALLLALTMLLSAMSGCGGQRQQTQEVAPSVTEAMSEPSPEPTESPETLLYNALPARMQQAVDVGIAELSQMEDLNRIVTVGEASQMLQGAYVHRTGVESKTLNEMMTNPVYSERTANRGWVLNMPGVTDLEMLHGSHYENYEQWCNYLNQKIDIPLPLWGAFDNRLGMNTVFTNEEKGTFMVSSFGFDHVVRDAAHYYEDLMNLDRLYGPERSTHHACSLDYALKAYDSTTGKRFFELEDGYLNPEKELTAEDAAEYALRFYHFPNPMAAPSFVAAADVGGYNPEIITADLLAKETALPSASCTQLPANWHGVVMDDMVELEETGHLDHHIYEYEIQAVKDAGFNYIGLELDFNWLQEAIFENPSSPSEKDTFQGVVREEDFGKFSMERLEQLDQVVALCMKYDIHLNLRCTGIGGYSGTGKFKDHILAVANTNKIKDSLAANWQAIARRYADIPNEYMSFTLFTSAEETYSSAVRAKTDLLLFCAEAIRQVSPDRCIIAEICNESQNPAELAQAGLALSFRLMEPVNLFAHDSYFSYQQLARRWNIRGQSAVNNFSWPYQGTIDAQALLKLSHAKGATCEEVIATAQEYNVGFMLGDFGVHIPSSDGHEYSRVRYGEEAYHAMITDITSTMEELGYGWCFSHWYGPYGVAFCLPVIQDVVYAQVADYPYYIDQGMRSLFRQINDVP